jgi:hypothetical protein
MICRIIFAVFLFVGAVLFAEENYGLNDPSFVPSVAYVGDRVIFRVELVAPESARVLSPPSLPSEKWIDVTDVRVTHLRKLESRNVFSVVVYFTSFRPGVQQLPPLRLGDITLRDIEVTTLSILPQDEPVRLSPLLGQLLHRATLRIVAIVAGSTVGVVLAVYFLVRFGLALFLTLSQRRKRKQPAKRMKANLRKLARIIGRIDVKEFFRRYSTIVKLYIEERFGYRAFEMTTGEIRTIFEQDGFDAHITNNIIGILVESDLVKFGGEQPDLPQIRTMTERAATLWQRIERGGANARS